MFDLGAGKAFSTLAVPTNILDGVCVSCNGLSLYGAYFRDAGDVPCLQFCAVRKTLHACILAFF